MEFEFEGRTEKEAIDRAAGELGLEKDDFDVEILETQKSGLFKKGLVRIKVHVPNFGTMSRSSINTHYSDEYSATGNSNKNRINKTGKTSNEKTSGLRYNEGSRQVPQDEFEEKMLEFMSGLIERMNYPGKVSIMFREKNKLGIKIDSSHSSILIGKKGKNLDALQLLANIYAGRIGHEDKRVVLDSENYRIRREESLVRLAYTVADRVREIRGSILLEPMNPFDRRIVHTTLNDIADVETRSEGEGLYKQIRIYYRGL